MFRSGLERERRVIEDKIERLNASLRNGNTGRRRIFSCIPGGFGMPELPTFSHGCRSALKGAAKTSLRPTKRDSRASRRWLFA